MCSRLKNNNLQPKEFGSPTTRNPFVHKKARSQQQPTLASRRKRFRGTHRSDSTYSEERFASISRPNGFQRSATAGDARNKGKHAGDAGNVSCDGLASESRPYREQFADDIQ